MSHTTRTHGAPPRSVVARALWAAGCTPRAFEGIEALGGGFVESWRYADELEVMLPLAIVCGRTPAEVARVAAGCALVLLEEVRGGLEPLDAKLFARALDCIAQERGCSPEVAQRVAESVLAMLGAKSSGERETVFRLGHHAAAIAARPAHLAHQAVWDAQQAGERAARAVELLRERSPQLVLGEPDPRGPDEIEAELLLLAWNALEPRPVQAVNEPRNEDRT